MQFIGTIICILVGLRLMQAIASAWQDHAAAKAQSDRTLALLDEQIAATQALRIRREQEQFHWNGYRRFRVKQKVIETSNICSFYLVPHDGKPLPAFQPGQFLTFRFTLPGTGSSEPRKVVRCYSLSDCPRSEQFRITVKRVPAQDSQSAPGLISNYMHDEVEAGDLLDVQAPRGDFAIEPEDTRPVVLLAGGIGITPLLSMVNSIFACGDHRDVWLFYGVRNGSEHVMKQHLQRLEGAHDRFHLCVVYSAPDVTEKPGGEYHHKGHLTVDVIRDTVKVCNFDFFVCGPRPMMQSIIPALLDWGVAENRIHMEAFGPATLQKQSNPQHSEENDGGQNNQAVVTVEFSRTGRSEPWDGKSTSLLDFALNHGITIDSGCRAGSCGSCEVAIKQGQITTVTEPSVDCDAGSCLTCISIPDGSVVLDA